MSDEKTVAGETSKAYEIKNDSVKGVLDKNNKVVLDAFHKLRCDHVGVVENAVALKSDATYEKTTVTLDDGSTVEAYAYVAPEERNLAEQPYAVNQKAKAYSATGTFTVSSVENSFGKFDNVAYNKDEKQEGEVYDGIVNPNPALMSSHIVHKHLDRHWRQGEDIDNPVDNENYLSRPGMKVKTSETYLAQENAEDEAEA